MTSMSTTSNDQSAPNNNMHTHAGMDMPTFKLPAGKQDNKAKQFSLLCPHPQIKDIVELFSHINLNLAIAVGQTIITIQG